MALDAERPYLTRLERKRNDGGWDERAAIIRALVTDRQCLSDALLAKHAVAAAMWKLEIKTLETNARVENTLTARPRQIISNEPWILLPRIVLILRYNHNTPHDIGTKCALQ